MKSPNRKRKVSSISNSRWISYAMAGAATTLTGGNSAEAEIHYSGIVNIKLSGLAQASLPLSNGASLAFYLFGGLPSFYLQTGSFLIKGAVSGAAHARYGRDSRPNVANMQAHREVEIRKFRSVAGDPGRGNLFSYGGGEFTPPGFGPGIRGFIGFRFNVGNGPQYGWARIHTERYGPHGQVRYIVGDYAWADVGERILTDQKASLPEANANSDSGFLGQLAFGWQGLEAWRQVRARNSN